MSAFDYIATRADAYAILSEFGKLVSVIKYDPAPADPTKSWRDRGASQTVKNGMAVIVPAGGSTLGWKTQVTDLLKRGSAAVFIVALTDSTDISSYDLVNDGVYDWRVDVIEKLDPKGGEPVLFFIGASR